MIRHLGFLASLAVALMAMGSSTSAASNAEQAAKTLQFFVGTWNCAHRVGDFSGTYVTSYTPALGSAWLKQTYDFPASKAEPAVHAEYFLGFDDRVSRWVRFGAHSNGMYFGMTFKGPADTAIWKFGYVLPGSTGEAIWTKKSETEYTVDGPSYPQAGRTVTEHHDCKKSS